MNSITHFITLVKRKKAENSIFKKAKRLIAEAFCVIKIFYTVPVTVRVAVPGETIQLPVVAS